MEKTLLSRFAFGNLCTAQKLASREKLGLLLKNFLKERNGVTQIAQLDGADRLEPKRRSDSLSSFSVLTAIFSSLSQNEVLALARERDDSSQFAKNYRSQQIQLRLLRLRHRPRRFSSSPLRFCLSAAGTFQMGKNFFRSIEDFFWQAGETRHLDAVTLVRAAGDDFAEENDLLVPFAHGDVEIAYAFAVLGEFGQLVIMRGEQTCAL